MGRGWTGLAMAGMLLLAGCVSTNEPGITPTPASVTGLVVDPDGKPIEGAEVWVEDTDLTRPVDNIDEYQALREATQTLTDGDGHFSIELRGTEAPYVTARLPGHRPVRAAPTIEGDTATVVLRLPRAEGPLVIAHRGGAEYAPENTLSAFRKSIALGADILEMDVQLTADGQLVVIHDLRLDRTTSGSGRVAAHTLAELQALDAGSWFFLGDFAGEPVPSLRDVFLFVEGDPVRLLIDVKAEAGLHASTVDRVVELVQEHGLKDRVAIAGFSEDTAARCRSYEGYYCIFMGRATQTEDEILGAALEVEADAVRVVASRFNEPFGQLLQSYGFDIIVGAANDEVSWTIAADLGAYAIGTDRPGHLLDVLAGRAQLPDLRD